MDFRDLLNSLGQLSEATKEKEGGRVHTADPGGYGRKFDTDIEGNEKKPAKADEPKRGRGRPKKDSDDSGEVKKYDTKSLQNFMIGNKPKKEVGTVSKKHSLKEYFEEVSEAKQLDEMMPQQPIPVVSKQGDTQQTGAGFLNITDNSPAGQAMKDALMKLAQQKKAQIVMPTGQQQSGTVKPAQPGSQQNMPAVAEEGEKWIQKAIKHPGSFSAKAKAAGKSVAAFAKEKAHAPGTLGKQARLAQTLRKMHEEALDQPATMEAEGPMLNAQAGGLGAGRDPKVLEGSKPDFLDLDKDGNKKESMKKAASDAKKTKKKVDESIVMEGYKDLLDNLIAKIDSAHFKSAYNIKGYKPDQAEEKILNLIHADDDYKVLTPANQKHLAKMAVQHYSTEHQLDETDMDEGFKPTPVPPQNIPAVARKSMGAEPLRLGDVMRPDPSSISSGENLRMRAKGQEPKPLGLTMKDIRFESWDKQLNSLLNEGITVSSSTGQQGSPDTVTVSATDADANQLLQVLRQAGVGVFGGGEQEHSGYGAPVSDEEPTGTGTEPEVSPEVVGDGDDMLALIKKMTGIEAGPEGTAEVDYEEEQDDDTGEEGSDSEAAASDEGSDEGEEGSGEESDESDDESQEEVDEGNKYAYNVLKAKAAGKKEADLDGDGDMDPVKEEEDTCNECGMYESQCSCDHEEVTEWANDAGGNGTEDTEMAKLKALLALGNDLNKKKRDQTVLNPTQVSVAEAINDWKKLSGIK